MQPSLATGRFIFGTPLHQRPRETRGGVRAPRLSESGLCRGCTRSHRRKAPQIAGDFEIPSAETKTRAKSDTYVAEGPVCSEPVSGPNFPVPQGKNREFGEARRRARLK